ncbi:unnamed protein product [Rotaria socialis]|uniref:Uncharacterized protein n=1 Tax=Rotaria socialis TaxID=392032 RepID=A0A820EDB2_9BILA|nr:unnamed protein product [Rotaria socialis]CAF3314985.1 unnamed protein product [Rotaria socialis]CAF3336194.1 unnamed protein product [Rotaria socialis]CAF3457371.1 unnamed protein product [Rotaria socialis]CAF4209626.1 unnamed protein product [Rotaria socialis]
MHRCFHIVLPVLFVIISGAFSIAPGDPFSIDTDNRSESSERLTSKHAFNTTQSAIESKLIDKYLLENQLTVIDSNKTFIHENKLLPSTTMEPVREAFRIHRKHLTQIAQWKYTDPETHQTRYWYHTVGSRMGDGWIFDGILCQAYTQAKPDTIPIHGFHSESKDIWLNTLQTESKLLPIGNNQWQYDGIIFYAYKTSMNSSLLKPVRRYWNKINYGTEDVSEPRRSYFRMGDLTEDDLPGWRLEHLIFYAFPPDFNVTLLEN